jgi:ribonuclease HII
MQNVSDDKIYVALDEAGRGCLAGDVYCAAVIWNPELTHPMVDKIKDSKKLSSHQREVLYEFIAENAIDYAVSYVDVETIDSVNILQANMKAMHQALDSLSVNFEHILVDGNYFLPYKNIPHTCIVKGDDNYIPIAAASILAKVTRDRYMKDLAQQYPEYGWDTNFGYGTPEHIAAIKEHGITKHHRRSFAPCAEHVRREE